LDIFMPEIIDYEFGISAIESHYERTLLAAVHLIVEDGRAVIIDTAHNGSVPHVLAALEAKGLARDAVDYVVVTHVHLDHAGGAGSLMAALPGAKLVAHPRGARHVVDPSQLWAGVRAVYGAEESDRRYGRLVPVPVERVIEAPDGYRLPIGKSGRYLEFLDSPGHARHHFVVLDSLSGHIFTGDAFGLSYREFDVEGRPSIFPSTSPVQFDPHAFHATIDRILALKPAALYMTHYAQVKSVDWLGAELHRLVDAHADIARGAQHLSGAERSAALLQGVTALAMSERDRHGWQVFEDEVMRVLGVDIQLNADGLAVWLDSQAKA